MSLSVPGSRTDKWNTPLALFEQMNAKYGPFTLDPCPPNPTMDGLAIPWAPHRVWLNPPYGRGRIRPWLEKAVCEARRGAFVVALLPSYTGSPWWHDIVIPNASEIVFLRGKLRFGDARGVAPFWSAIVTFGRQGVAR